ncbi:MAG: DMT family transporter [Gemmataceae bacterium]|nr:DMT family transporter [Gemmataceae bacterium]
MTHTTVFALLAAGAGACIALQASANGRFRHNLGSPEYAAFFSICGTVLTAVAVMLLVRPPVPDAAKLRQTEWWNWVGGPLGAVIVLAGASLVGPGKLTAAVFIAAVVAGQLLCSLALDHFALMGLAPAPLTPGRVLGAGLVVAGVVCIKSL